MVRKGLTLTMLVLIMGIGARFIVYAQANTYTPQPSVYKVDSRKDSSEAESRYRNQVPHRQRAAMVYSWKATAVVPFEFHGVPDQNQRTLPPSYYESHEKDDVGKNQSHGHFISPSTGIHGWWRENKTDKDVTIDLTTAGFYDTAIEFSETGKKDLEIQDLPSRVLS